MSHQENNYKTLKQNIKDINKRKEEVSQSFQHDLDFIDYRVPQSMRMELQTAFSSNVINESFKNAKNIAKKAAKQFNLLADTDIFHNLLANASSVLYSKTHKYEHNGNLMKNPIDTLLEHSKGWSITTLIALERYITLQIVRQVHALVMEYFIIG